MILPTIPTRTDLATRASAAMAAMPPFHRRSLADWHVLLVSDCPLPPCTMLGAGQDIAWAEDVVARIRTFLAGGVPDGWEEAREA